MTWPLARRRGPGWCEPKPVTIEVTVEAAPEVPTCAPSGWTLGLPTCPGKWAIGVLVGECVFGFGVVVTAGALGADESCAGMEFVHRAVS